MNEPTPVVDPRDPEVARRNVRLALGLLAVVLTFFFSFFVVMAR